MVRKIEEADAFQVAEICRKVLGHMTSAELLQKNIIRLKDDPEYYISVYADEKDPGKVEGLIQAQRYDLLYGGRGWNIIALAASPEVQGKGIGKKLMQALEAYAQAQGAAFVRLNSRIERSDAHKFYEHLGYRCDKTQKRFIKYFDR